MAVGEYARLVVVLLGTLLFINFIAVDIRKAFKKGVHWVPGHALVLTALTIQIMTFVENQSNRDLLGSQTLEEEASENNFIMIHSSRVMLCVLVAFFLPGMARASYQEKWTKIAALGLTVFIDIFSELFTVYRRLPHSKYGVSRPSKHGVSWVSFMVSDMLISISLLWLILLLICVTRASKSIRNITNQKIPIILAEKAKPGLANYWEAVQNQVLKSWIVVCVCYPQSIIAKSVLASSAALVVTMCIASSVVGWIVRGSSITIPSDAESLLKGIITILEVVFILLGWVVLCWRTLASLPYYGRRKEKSWVAWFKQFLVEDFWTGHIQEELKKEESKYHFGIAYFWTKQVEAKEYESHMSSPVSSLLTGKMLPPLCVGVRGSFIPRSTQDETAAGPDSRLKFLCKPEPGPPLKEETYFKYMSRRSWSWKLTAVSLINIIVSLSPPCGRESLQAYFQAWQLMDMVDEWDRDSDSLLRKAADREFDTLVGRVAKNTDESCPVTIPVDKMAEKITELADRKKKELEKESEKEKQSTPVDWEKLAAAIALYKLYTRSAYYTSDAQPKNGLEYSGEIAELKNEFGELMKELESSLADIISACIDKVGTALVDNCRRWAQDLEEEKEDKLVKAIYIAGKSRGLVEALGWNPHIDKTTEGWSM